MLSMDFDNKTAFIECYAVYFKSSVMLFILLHWLYWLHSKVLCSYQSYIYLPHFMIMNCGKFILNAVSLLKCLPPRVDLKFAASLCQEPRIFRKMSFTILHFFISPCWKFFDDLLLGTSISLPKIYTLKTFCCLPTIFSCFCF